MEKIILLHGALGHSADLEPLAKALQQNGLHPLLFNFSGHGRKPFQKDFSIPFFADELSNFIQAQGAGSSAIFGYSMGGYVALKMAGSTQYSGTIVTLGTRLSWSQEFAASEIQKLNPEKIQEKIPAFATRLLQAHGESWKDLVKNTAGLLSDLGANNYLNEELLKKIKSKVVLGLGDRDNMADAADTVRVSRTITNGEMYMLPGTKHQIESVDAGFLSEMVYRAISK
jgi:esterase/lipase